ncbi:unnamed protein product [Sphagnum balticum]
MTQRNCIFVTIVIVCRVCTTVVASNHWVVTHNGRIQVCLCAGSVEFSFETLFSFATPISDECNRGCVTQAVVASGLRHTRLHSSEPPSREQDGLYTMSQSHDLLQFLKQEERVDDLLNLERQLMNTDPEMVRARVLHDRSATMTYDETCLGAHEPSVKALFYHSGITIGDLPQG